MAPVGSEVDGGPQDPVATMPEAGTQGDRPHDSSVPRGVEAADERSDQSADERGVEPAGSEAAGSEAAEERGVEPAATGAEMRAESDGAEPYSYQDGPPTGEVRIPVSSPITQSRVGGLVGLLASLVMLGPWLWSGEILVRDLAAVADPVINLDAFARGAGPSWDLLGQSMAVLAGQLVGMDNLVRVVLVGSFIALGAGAGRLSGTNGSRVAAAVAAMAATWNPFVWSRLDQGEWLTVMAIAALPWVVIHLRADHRWRLARATALAGLAGGAGWVIVAPTLVIVAVVARRARAAIPAMLVLVATAIPSVIAAGRFEADPAGFEAMAARADLPTGLVTSVLTGGGHWNPVVAPPSRSSWVVALVAVIVAAASIYGAGRWRESPRLLHDWRTRSGLALAALVGFVGVLVMASAAGQAVVGGLASVAPWLAAVRNSTNLLAPWVLVLAVGLGHLAWRGARWLRTRVVDDATPAIRQLAGSTVALVVIVGIVLLLPDPRGSSPLPPTGEVPASWALAARMINAEPAADEERSEPGTVLMVPGDRYQDYDMAPVEVVSPLQALVSVEVLADSRWQVVRDGTIVVVDDEPPVATGTGSGEPTSAPTPTPSASPTEASVIIDAADPEASVAPTTDGPSPSVVRTLASQWPGQLDGQELAELGVEWVAIVQPDAFAAPGDGLVRELIAPEIELLRVDPEQFLVATQPRALWPLLLDGLVATLVLALLVSAGPLRTGREMDPV